MTLTPLPNIMVAPNGARRGPDQHPALPITDAQVISTAIACAAAGADGIHAHIRDAKGQHVLDADRYRALSAALKSAVPNMYIQVTSESAGRYGADEQQAMMRALEPAYVSASLREMVRKPDDWATAKAFYHWAKDAGVAIQHIVFSPQELNAFIAACRAGHIPAGVMQMQLVLGTYDGTQISHPEDIATFTSAMTAADDLEFDWMLCAFGPQETDCLLETVAQGGKARIGFENSLWNQDGSLARDNAERVGELVALLAAQ